MLATLAQQTTRPDPGLARGRWEAAPWMFYVVIGVVVASSGLYWAWRAGLLRRKKVAEPAPTSKRSRP